MHSVKAYMSYIRFIIYIFMSRIFISYIKYIHIYIRHIYIIHIIKSIPYIKYIHITHSVKSYISQSLSDIVSAITSIFNNLNLPKIFVRIAAYR